MSLESAEELGFAETELPPHLYTQGPNTLDVDRSKLHGGTRTHALKLMRNKGHGKGLILLQGGGPFHIYDTDMEGLFRQESFFHYLFGVEEEDYFGVVNIETGHTTLFMPRLPSAYAVWMGRIDGPDAKKIKYAVNEVHYVDEMSDILKQLNPEVIYVLEGTNSDSQRKSLVASFDGLDQFKVDTKSLYNILCIARSIKTPVELDIIRYTNQIASAAHVELMRHCRPGLMEYAMESNFRNKCYLEGGCRSLPYTPICASGPNAAVLHYGHTGAPNNRQIGNGDLLLLDMGCNYYGYGSDITCTYPANGRFSRDQSLIYEAVLSAHSAVLKAMKPGVRWPDMHILAENRILTALKEGGLLKGDLKEMIDFRVGALFMPHGLGHLLGLETHDVGGYIDGIYPKRSDLPGLKNLRTARVLEAGMVITVEPGCYFNPSLLEPVLKNPEHALAKFLVKSKIQTFMGFGGVRIEDDVLVTETGCESFTDVPRSVDDVEQTMSGKSWP